MISRRQLLKGALALAAGTSVFGGYAFGVEPRWRLNVTRYALTPPRWPEGLALRVALIADVHASEPYMPVSRIDQIVARTNALSPDVTLLLGDYITGHRWETRPVPAIEWSAALGELNAPFGVHAILGNHDWWDDRTAQRQRKGPTVARAALEGVGIPVYENDVFRIEKGGQAFWLAGLGDQLAFKARRGRKRGGFEGIDDLPATLAKVTDDAPVILMAHEPDIFPRVPDRVALTVSGHTHGGQVRLFGYSPIVPSHYGNRYAYGHIVEGREQDTATADIQLAELDPRRHLIVSGGLGCSILPVRFGVPPEIVVIDIGRSLAA